MWSLETVEVLIFRRRRRCRDVSSFVSFEEPNAQSIGRTQAIQTGRTAFNIIEVFQVKIKHRE